MNIPTRQPLDPRPELCAVDLTMELHDALAVGGHPVPIDVIRGWSPDCFFEALRYARACRDRLSGSVDEPEKQEWLP